MSSSALCGRVNSHDDFSPLEEIIVGHPFHSAYVSDVSSRLFYPKVTATEWEASGVSPTAVDGPRASLVEEMWEDHAGLVGLLEDCGVTVRVPDLATEPSLIKTPDWEVLAGHCTMIRDSVLVIADELIETPPLVRSRYFETNLYKTLFYEYFESGARWTVAPRPRMREVDFDYSFVREEGWWTSEVPVPERYEIMFDAPQVVRLGRDLVFNCSLENHILGAEWLQRHLGPEYRVHTVTTGIDDHLDCVLIPLRPGLILAHEDFDLQALPQPLARWDVIRYRPEERVVDYMHDLPILASPAIFMNVLSLDEERVIVDSEETGLMKLLEARGLTPIPCTFRHGRLIGGGFHCNTLDVRRRGGAEDYLAG